MREVLETRTTPEGYKLRTRLDSNGKRTLTIEVPLRVWARVCSPGRAKDRASQAVRAIHRQELKDAAVARLLAGEKPLAIEFDIGVPARTLQRWRKEKKDGQA